ncbi:(E)-4-hydroxy-3-methylbut-2-enyl-diphosphate synthase [Cryomorpha ignava]|uniref:4-hydroxy-3-methylbut-2-en-1-yl diphosphate synthase (flavodoxin) n=1 Tax=Cryomorpha ignava TaxID=101383 RepID=A0A7K3WSR3_9FLAO|nr:(E)-4-hydroxy-3-methylbut-2-enyl-diphosphate synthase [Cryomorpha ignava]NEN24568.1 (E)-4-hydroxy-3-methylbut-2-enyl-diphosphate synthase [Cryomorpha ignava]
MSTAISDDKKYTTSLITYHRFKTREVKVGNIGIGGDNPIRIQSMTTTDTMDTQKTIDQSIRMIEAGCEIVRITAPTKNDAINLGPIKDGIRAAGYATPLVADIHFTPNAAEIAAGIVEKVRVNPGNYADKKKFENIEYTDETYNSELERIRKRFTPLVLLCKQNGAAMRIGTNHGSLSDRIMSRYGDTPQGMVESAMEFLRICRDHDYHDIVLSMKASNCKIMVEAYRLLMVYMMREDMNYPLHLGVTEAGEGEDGRVKSAVGIGTLLEDGIGDTVRVSLTEEPEAEIPVAEMLVKRYAERGDHDPIPEIIHNPINPFEFNRRETDVILNIGKGEVPRIIGDLSERETIKPASLFAFGYNYSIPLDKWNITDQATDFIFVGNNEVDFQIPGTLGIIANADYWKKDPAKPRYYPLITKAEFEKEGELSQKLNFIQAEDTEIYNDGFIDKLKQTQHSVLVLSTQNTHAVAALRRVFMELMNAECRIPVMIYRKYNKLNKEELQLYSATDFGALLIDGLSDGIWLKSNVMELKAQNALTFGILQATRTRISKTEYISCPSCGRTLFDLQETTAKIRSRTDHLKGLKIGIMGCIVNGPGEMADADYGYVGTGVGKITLYKEKDVVKRNVSSEHAVDELIELIKLHGDWIEPLNPDGN